MIEDREAVGLIEREIKQDPNTRKRTVLIFVVRRDVPADFDLIGELEKTTKLSREAAERLGFDPGPSRTTRNRYGCREFDLYA